MANAKIEIKVGQIEFSGEGEHDWVAKQLDKILAKAEDLVALAPPPRDDQNDQSHSEEEQHTPMKKDAKIASKTLPSFLNEKNASKNQVRKFLATAVWLEAKGNKRIATSDVTKALKDSNQSRLAARGRSLFLNSGIHCKGTALLHRVPFVCWA